MTIICFELSMPNRGSWNGGWSGEERLYARIRRFGRGKAANDQSERILAEGSYYHSFGDGWGASVGVREVSAAEARKIENKSAGFCGYDWMIQSIIDCGEISVTRKGAAV